MKPSTVSNLAMAAAFAGLLGGTAARLNAQPLPGHSGTSPVIVGALAADGQQLPKHSCKGQGACATDGSKPPKS